MLSPVVKHNTLNVLLRCQGSRLKHNCTESGDCQLVNITFTYHIFTASSVFIATEGKIFSLLWSFSVTRFYKCVHFG